MTAEKNIGRYEFIDALRGLAFLGVLVHHTGGHQMLPARLARIASEGHEGVELFFMCSAMTLFLSLASRRRREERQPIANYLIRRFFRIAPLFFFGALVYHAIDRMLGRGGDIGPGAVLSTLTFANAWSVPWINRLVPGGWSIAVEMNFYLLVPLLFRLVTTAERAVWATSVTLIGGAIASAVASVILPRLLGPDAPVGPFLWYWLPTHLPIFCLGFLLYFVIRPILRDRAEGLPAPRGRANLLLLIAGYLITALCFIQTAFYLGHILFAVAFFLLGWSLALNPNRMIVNPALRAIGTVSFSAYLTHFAALDLVEYGLGSLPALGPVPRFLALTLGTLAVTLPLSALTYHLIEIPGQRLGRSLIARLESPPAMTPSPALA